MTTVATSRLTPMITGIVALEHRARRARPSDAWPGEDGLRAARRRRRGVGSESPTTVTTGISALRSALPPDRPGPRGPLSPRGADVVLAAAPRGGSTG